jgi:hypothetical protein
MQTWFRRRGPVLLCEFHPEFVPEPGEIVTQERRSQVQSSGHRPNPKLNTGSCPHKVAPNPQRVGHAFSDLDSIQRSATQKRLRIRIVRHWIANRGAEFSSIPTPWQKGPAGAGQRMIRG